MLLAAWISYDSGRHGLAQRYFIQALGLAEAGRNRLLGASILDAMSHQATFLGRCGDAATLASAARTGTRGLATATLIAHFHAMEARALARAGDRRGCHLALADTERNFERRDAGADPEWFQYFDHAELAAELSHCFRDLGSTPPPPASSPRSGPAPAAPVVTFSSPWCSPTPASDQKPRRSSMVSRSSPGAPSS
jgi:hypothetical protein